MCSQHINLQFQAHHSHKSSEITVPANPFISSRVQIFGVGGTSNVSIPVKCHVTKRGRRRMKSKSPANPVPGSGRRDKENGIQVKERKQNKKKE